MKKTLVTLMMVLLVVLSACTTKEEEKETVEDKKEYVAGFDNTFAPMGFQNEEGKDVGFDLDLAEKLSEKLGVTFKFQSIDWSLKETELEAGNIDMIWNGYSVTEERKAVVEFSIPYMTNNQLILVPKDSAIKTKADLVGKKVSTQDQSSALEAIKADPIAKELGSLTTYASYNEVFNDLTTGRADAIVVDETMGLYYLSTSGLTDQYIELKDNFGEEDYAVGFRKNEGEFVEKFNKALQELIDDGTVKEIYSKWFQ